MEVEVKKGKYVLAVSGGVDSMVLLDILAKQVTGDRLRVTDLRHKHSNLQSVTSNLELILAHFNHGIRPDAHKDEKLVRNIAHKYGLPLEVGRGNLGPQVSEDRARAARYKFLKSVKRKFEAAAIITAHHQDDLIETAFLNILRGTGHRGLVAIAKNPQVKRPLLNTSKSEILDYAKKHNITWREDPTNRETVYLRNYIRRYIVSRLTPEQRRSIVSNIEKVAKNSDETDKLIATISHQLQNQGAIDRAGFTKLPFDVSSELLMYWLRQQGIKQFDRGTIERLNLAIRTAKPNTKHEIKKGFLLSLNRSEAHFEPQRS